MSDSYVGQNPGLALDGHNDGMIRLRGDVLRGMAWYVGKVPWSLVGLMSRAGLEDVL